MSAESRFNFGPIFDFFKYVCIHFYETMYITIKIGQQKSKYKMYDAINKITIHTPYYPT